MNEKVKKAVTLLPVILVPLLNERRRIKQHPDVQKLEEKSSHAYHAAKDKSASAVGTLKDVGGATYTTGRAAFSKVSGAIDDRRSERLHNKEIKQYEDSLKEAKALEARFQKDKEEHRKSRLKEIQKSEVPKIMQPQDETDSGSSDGSGEDPVAPETKADMKSNPDNYGIALAYEDDRAASRMIADEGGQDDVYSTEDDGASAHSSSRDDALNETSPNNREQERLDNMNQNMNHYIENKVKGHEEENYENGPLFTKHKNILDPKHAASKPSSTSDDQNSLFNRHRTMQEERVSEIGRRTGEPGSMTKSKKQMKLEKKIEKQRRKQYR